MSAFGALSMSAAIGLCSLCAWLVLLLGRRGFWRVRTPRVCPAPRTWPAVVTIIPARNEAEVLPQTLPAVLGQDYPGPFTVIVVDDHSTDDTAARALAIGSACQRLDRLVVLEARTLPEGWTGKVWAQAEGLAHADGLADGAPAALEASETAGGAPRSYAWFTDADIWHPPGALRALVACAEDEKRVLTSLMVRLRCESWAERALIPAFVFFFAKLYPFEAVSDGTRPTAAAAGGCMLACRNALAQIGGLAAIRHELIDDCALAAALKKVGPIRLDLAESSASLRCYPRLSSIWDMIARTAFTQLNYSVGLLGATVLGMGLLYLVPPGLALTRGLWSAWLAWLIMSFCYLPMLRYYRRSVLWAPFLPLVALFYLCATLDSARRYWRGAGGQWKGRAQARSLRETASEAPPGKR